MNAAEGKTQSARGALASGRWDQRSHVREGQVCRHASGREGRLHILRNVSQTRANTCRPLPPVRSPCPPLRFRQHTDLATLDLHSALDIPPPPSFSDTTMSSVTADDYPVEAVKTLDQHDDTVLNGVHKHAENGDVYVEDANLKHEKLSDISIEEPSAAETAEPETVSDDVHTRLIEASTEGEVIQVRLTRTFCRITRITHCHSSLHQKSSTITKMHTTTPQKKHKRLFLRRKIP